MSETWDEAIERLRSNAPPMTDERLRTTALILSAPLGDDDPFRVEAAAALP